MTPTRRHLVVDVGTSGVRAAVVGPDADVGAVTHRTLLPSTPAPGLVEIDPPGMAAAVLDVARSALDQAGPVDGVGIANQRATTIVWERATGRPLGPAIGWQDLRTVVACLLHQADGVRLAPNMSATKLAAILDEVDPDRSRADAGELAFGTVDTWVAWTLSEGSLHVTDASNAAVTGLAHVLDGSVAWDPRVCELLRIPHAVLPAIVDSSGLLGPATALPGAPPICGIAGDQQASLVGQGCTLPGLAKATFGTGGMLDLCVGPTRSRLADRGDQGTFSIVAWQAGGVPVWGVEAVMLSAGTCLEWLRDDLGIIDDAASSAALAATVPDTAGVAFVPALLGLGTPLWDFGARGTLLGLTRGTTRAHIVRAVLEGIAHRGADLLDAAEADASVTVDSLRVDGGMSANPVFAQALADAIGRPVQISRHVEATTLGAGLLAGLATGAFESPASLAELASPRIVLEPTLSDADRTEARDRWFRARERALHTTPDLSGIAF